MMRIDVRAVLQRTAHGSYGDLVTRPTGQAVRSGIEQILTGIDGEQVAVIDFGAVGCLDISCADEIVGKLLIEHGRARYLLLHGVSDAHCDAIQQVLERHGLAVVARDRGGRLQLLGPLEDLARRAFSALSEGGTASADELAARLAVAPDTARAALDTLREHRVVRESAGAYMVSGAP
jgi:hypothetical protein